jgi:hypothetical protein
MLRLAVVGPALDRRYGRGICAARRFAAVEYRDAEHPWFRLREQIREKCDKVVIEFEHASGEVTPETRVPPAEK